MPAALMQAPVAARQALALAQDAAVAAMQAQAQAAAHASLEVGTAGMQVPAIAAAVVAAVALLQHGKSRVDSRCPVLVVNKRENAIRAELTANSSVEDWVARFRTLAFGLGTSHEARIEPRSVQEFNLPTPEQTFTLNVSAGGDQSGSIEVSRGQVVRIEGAIDVRFLEVRSDEGPAHLRAMSGTPSTS